MALALRKLEQCPYQVVKECDDVSICLDTVPTLDEQMDRLAVMYPFV